MLLLLLLFDRFRCRFDCSLLFVFCDELLGWLWILKLRLLEMRLLLVWSSGWPEWVTWFFVLFFEC